MIPFYSLAHWLLSPLLAANMGHYYQVQRDTQTWADAKTFAESLTWFGMQGHLATVESASEHFAIQAMIDNSDHWIGGSDAATKGSWKWESGPSAGQMISPSFWRSSPSDHQDCLQYKLLAESSSSKAWQRRRARQASRLEYS
jgi:hypothetical protein